MPLKILHFADAHIDIANYGRHDPESGLPQRVVDFLKSMDQIVDTAIDEKVDLVIFAGDAYKDRNPQPTFQREWGRRMMRLAAAGIPTILLIGNHDVAPAEYRAHTLQEFKTLEVPGMLVADDGIQLWGPAELGVPAHVVTVPWITRSRLMARHDMAGMSSEEIQVEVENRVAGAIKDRIGAAGSDLPLILTAHASVQGAKYGSERLVKIGHEFVLSRALVEDQRLDYVALGHIHRHQVLSERPPVIYAGSIERIDFGEEREAKGFVVAEVERGKTTWEFRQLDTRPFNTTDIELESGDGFMDDLLEQLPSRERIAGAICRLIVSYPAEYEALLDEDAVRAHYADALDFRLVKQRTTDDKVKTPDGAELQALPPDELLQRYLKMRQFDEAEAAELQTMATEIFATAAVGAD